MGLIQFSHFKVKKIKALKHAVTFYKVVQQKDLKKWQ